MDIYVPDMAQPECTETAPGTVGKDLNAGERCYIRGPHDIHYAQSKPRGGRTRWGKRAATKADDPGLRFADK